MRVDHSCFYLSRTKISASEAFVFSSAAIPECLFFAMIFQRAVRLPSTQS